MQLALGTVQFGLRYGVAGRGEPVPEAEVRGILQRAAQLGITMLDTAAAYGDIEPRLQRLAGDLGFRVVTKLAALPAGIAAQGVSTWVADSLRQARERLGPLLHAVMFHRADDLLGEHGAALWDAAAGRCADLKLGVSCYDPETLQQVRTRLPGVALAQLPGNAFDQRLRLRQPGPQGPIELHLRSAFLQGLLLMPEAQAVARVPRAAVCLQRWHAGLRERGLDPLLAALGAVKALPGVDHCVVGVDNLGQLEAIAQAWAGATPLDTQDFACTDLDVIDPRRWPAQA